MNTEKKEKLLAAIREAIALYSRGEEAFGDEPYLKLDVERELAEPVAEAEVPEDEDGYDYYPLLDLTRMDPSNPGRWVPDEETLAELFD